MRNIFPKIQFPVQLLVLLETASPAVIIAMQCASAVQYNMDIMDMHKKIAQNIYCAWNINISIKCRKHFIFWTFLNPQSFYMKMLGPCMLLSILKCFKVWSGQINLNLFPRLSSLETDLWTWKLKKLGVYYNGIFIKGGQAGAGCARLAYPLIDMYCHLDAVLWITLL